MTNTVSVARIVEIIGLSATTLREVIGYELGGKSVLRCTAGFMSEHVGDGSAEDYYRKFYDHAIREFWQLDDYDFVTHHASRVLFNCWQDELAVIEKSPFGRALARRDIRLPTPTKPTRERRRAAAKYWYDDVVRELNEGRLPAPRGVRNPLMSASESRAHALERTHGWFALLLSLSELWSSQVVLMWRVVRESIALSRLTRDLDEATAEEILAQDPASVLRVCSEYCSQYGRWHGMHVDTVDRHDPFFRKYLMGVEDWFGGHGADALMWPITEPTKDELYLEVASGVAQLRGAPYTIVFPEFRYWRRTPWTPAQLRPGAPGLPPFSVVDVSD